MNKLLLPIVYLSLSTLPLFAQTSEPSGVAGKISHGQWWNMGSSIDVESLWTQDAFYQPANSTGLLSTFEAPQNVANMFGQRLRGYLIAPVTGEYRFWASGDNGFTVWLSDGESKFSKQELIAIKGSVQFREWGRLEVQGSAPVLLEAGKRYYIEAQGKESTGADHLSVAWSYAEGSGLTNWARESGTTASQSSTVYGGTAAKAIDGNTSGSYADGSITHTLNNSGEWWQVDLGAERQIDRVELYNRNLDDTGAIKRLSNFRVSIINAAGTVTASQDFHTAGSHVYGIEYWETGGAQGSIVKVELLGPGAGNEEYLSLAEVKVWGRTDALAQSYQGLEVIPGTALESFAGSLNDADDDGYPDDWETLYGLDTTAYQGSGTPYAPLVDPDKDGMTNLEESLRGLNPLSSDSVDGYLTMERWTGIYEYDVADLLNSDNYYGEPEVREIVATTQFKDIDDYSGARLRGYITAPVSGNYRFWVSSRNGGQLWLSEDATKYSKQKLAEMGPMVGTGHGMEHTESNLWDRFASQMSKEVYLQAGQKYFIEMLTQQGHGTEKHVSAAWAPPGQAREELPLSVISSYGMETEDTDDDYLPDAWETQYGLSITDNGLTDRSREGENGDYDADGLNNRLEYLAGTDPTNADTDGDGIDDAAEMNVHGTDPLTSDAPSETIASTFDLNTFTGADYNWSLVNGSLLSDTFRGSITWNFTAPTSGTWVIQADTTLRGKLYANESVPVNAYIDGQFIGRYTLKYGASHKAIMRVTSPSLSAGNHTLTLMIDNLLGRRMVQIDSITLRQPNGIDTDGDGIPDWIENQLTAADYVTGHSTTSRTSPACLEGRARLRNNLLLNGQPVLAGGDATHWYSDLPLNATAATSYTATFANGQNATGTITWQATNVLDNETLTIRKGDSLLLTARPGGSSTGQSASLTVPTEDWTSHPGVTASQSTTAFGCSASRAIDGNTSGVWAGQSMTHTSNTAGSWWQTDLGADRAIDQIVLWNRTDAVQSRLSNYRVSILDASGNTVLSQDFHTGTSHTGDKEIWQLANTVTGRKVKVELLGLTQDNSYYLSLVEVEVLGTPKLDLASDADTATHTFNYAGSYTVSATHANGSTGALTVNVLQAAMPDDTTAVQNAVSYLTLQNSQTSQSLYFQGGNGLDLGALETINASSYRFRLYPRSGGQLGVVARLWENGPILDVADISSVTITDALQNGLTTAFASQEFEGYYLITTPLVVLDLPTGGKVEITIFRAGVTFPDGTKKKTLYTSDFNNGLTYLQFLFPQGMDGGYCHYIDIYDQNGAHIGRR